MHLLLAQKGTISTTAARRSISARRRATSVVLSAADTELASLAGGAARLGAAHSLRLVNLLQLKHPMSVDA